MSKTNKFKYYFCSSRNKNIGFVWFWTSIFGVQEILAKRIHHKGRLLSWCQQTYLLYYNVWSRINQPNLSNLPNHVLSFQAALWVLTLKLILLFYLTACNAAIKSLYDLIYVSMVICNIIRPHWAAAVARTPAGQRDTAAPSIMFIIHYTLHSARHLK